MHVATITIDHTKVAGDLTDYVVAVVNNSDAGWAELYALALEGGGDIRVYKSGGVTELPREIVSFSVVGETGEIHIKYTGTLSGSVDTDIEIHADGTSSDYAVTATYGRNAVWSDYAFVTHDGGIDSTGGRTMTANGGVSAGGTIGQIGKATNFTAASSQYFSMSNTTSLPSGNSDMTLQAIIKPTSVSTPYASIDIGTNSLNQRAGLYTGNYGGIGALGFIGVGNDFVQPGVVTASVWNNCTATYLGSTKATNLYVDGSNVKTGTLGSNKNVTYGGGNVGANNAPSEYFDGDIDEVRIRNNVLSANWLTTEYNNQNSPSTFYSVVAATSSNVTVTPAAQTATFSLQAPTVNTVRNVTITPAVLTATSAAQTSTPSGNALYGATVLTVTTTAPVVVIDAGGNITIAISVMTASAALQAPTIAVESNIAVSPGVLSLTGSSLAVSLVQGTGVTISPVVQALTAGLQNPSILVEASRTVTPAVTGLTTSIIAPIKTGRLWTPVGRAGDSDEWTAVERVT